MRRRNKVYWGSNRSAIDSKGDNRGSLGEATVLFVSAIVWLLSIAAFIGVLALTMMVTWFLVMASLPCYLWNRFSPTGKSQVSWHTPDAKPVR